MIRLPVLAFASLALLAACDAPEPASAPGTAAPPASQVPAQPVPANVLTAEGLGPARIGMTTAELTTAWGADSDPEAVGGPEPEICDEYHPTGAPTGVNVMIQSGRLTRITLIDDAVIKTDRGFGLGDPALAIKETYGGSIVAQPHKYSDAPAEDLFAWARGGSTAYVQDPTARGLRYEIGPEGRVQMIHAGDPSIQLVEGCA